MKMNPITCNDFRINPKLHENKALALAAHEYVTSSRILGLLTKDERSTFSSYNSFYNKFNVDGKLVEECELRGSAKFPSELFHLYQKHCYELEQNCELKGTEYEDEDVWIGDGTELWYWECVEDNSYTFVPRRMTERQVRLLSNKYSKIKEMGMIE